MNNANNNSILWNLEAHATFHANKVNGEQDTLINRARRAAKKGDAAKAARLEARAAALEAEVVESHKWAIVIRSCATLANDPNGVWAGPARRQMAEVLG